MNRVILIKYGELTTKKGNRKFFIEIKFKKDVTVFKKGEKEPVGDNERRNIDDEFK